MKISSTITTAMRSMILDHGNPVSFFSDLKKYEWKVYTQVNGWFKISRPEVLRRAMFRKLEYRIFSDDEKSSEPGGITFDDFAEIL